MILCITHERLPGIRPCTHRGFHKVTCRDHEGWRVDLRPSECTGCFPRAADRGFLCMRCYEKVEQAFIRWDRFAKALQGVDRAVQRDNAGVRTRQAGYVPFAGTFLALDECERLLESFVHQSLLAWVSTEGGARDAIQFAHAAERAYRTHEIEEHESKLIRVRCAACGQMSFIRKPPGHERDQITIACQNEACGKTIREGDTTVNYTRHPDGWETEEVEKIDVLMAIEARKPA